MVVDDDKGAAIACRTGDAPLCSPAIDRSALMLLLDRSHDITCAKVAFVEAVNGMLCPEEADDALR
jgi:hypothetical protein